MKLPSQRIGEIKNERHKKISIKMSNENHPRWSGGKRYRLDDISKEKMRIYQRKLRAYKKEIVLKHYGNKCTCCGEKEVKFLTIDHINNDGTEHRKTLGGSGGGSIIIGWIVKNGFPKDMFQILCYNCNMSKGVYGECPHVFVSGINEEYIKQQECICKFDSCVCKKVDPTTSDSSCTHQNRNELLSDPEMDRCGDCGKFIAK